MIPAQVFFDAVIDAGIDFYTGVPCSFLTPVINRAISDSRTRYVGATSEGEAVAMAAGAWLAGRKTLVMMQNSGLGNAVNPLTSLNHPFRIPTLLVATLRGQPGIKDEPQHELMGQITAGMLELMRIPTVPFPSTPESVTSTVAAAMAEMEKGGWPFAFLMAKGSVADEPLDDAPVTEVVSGNWHDRRSHGNRPSRMQALEKALVTVGDDVAIVATTGKTGRELFTLSDRKQHFYLVGSMGGASAVGLGVALNVSRPVVVFDGDGAALMKMGNIATIGANRPANLVHVVLDNGVHDSTGGQSTVAPSVNFAAVAAACGYQSAVQCDGLESFATEFKLALSQKRGPVLIHLAIQPGSIEKLGRPTLKPHEVAQRFREFLAGQ